MNYIHTDRTPRASYGCLECGEIRTYGFTGDPNPAFILCGRCRKNTVHEFVKIVTGWAGRPCPLAPGAS